jgi:endoglucanase
MVRVSTLRRPWGLAVSAVAAFAVVALLAVPARAGVANEGIPGAPAGNPLAGLPWGNYNGPGDELFPTYWGTTGVTRSLLGKIALAPRMRWFGSWYPDDTAQQSASDYIANSTGGRDDVLSQIAIFRVEPWEDNACRRLPTAAERASYRSWIDAFAAGIGSSRVALVLQPDLPFALCIPHHSHLPLQLVAYAARVFGGLPHTTVYIDVGAADWPSVSQAVSMLRAAGIRYARGIALNITHYDSTTRQIVYGSHVAGALARAGFRGRHVVINTAQNGRPFTFQQYHGNFLFVPACRSRASRFCLTLGVPPTTDVSNRRWGLSREVRRLAARVVDAYLWIGRPWLDSLNEHLDVARALSLARTSPF